MRENGSAKRTRFANPFIDSQFKRIFNEETTRAFLNSVLNLECPIRTITILNSESHGASIVAKSIRIDVLCCDESGREFITEMQNVWERWLNDRLVFYTCRMVDEQARHYENLAKHLEGRRPEGESWDYRNMRPVYTVCILNDRDRSLEQQAFIQDVVLYDRCNRRVFSDAMRILVLNMTALQQKNEGDGDEYYRKMLCLMQKLSKNMDNIETLMAEVEAMQMPEEQKALCRRLISISDTSSMTEAEYIAYEEYNKSWRDHYNFLRAEREEGLEEGLKKGLEEGRVEGRAEGRAEGEAIGLEKGKAEGKQEGMAEVARRMKEDGQDIPTISKFTGLSEPEIKAL